MNKKIVVLFSAPVLAVLLLAPFAVLAQPWPRTLTVPITTVVVNLINITLIIVWNIAIAFTIIMFVLAGFKFMTAQGDPAKVSEAKLAVIWGLVGVAVIVLAWSAISIVRFQFGV